MVNGKFFVIFFQKNERLKNSATREPKIRNGAKGISLFIVRDWRLKYNKTNPTIAPLQKARSIALTLACAPRSQPKPKTSLASPKPIHLPPDTNQSKAKKPKSAGPARKSGERMWIPPKKA